MKYKFPISNILETVYKSLVESVPSFNMIMYYGNINIQRRNKLQRIVSMASKIIGKPQKHLSGIYEERITNKAEKIISDPSHPLHSEFELLPSGRRFRVPTANRNIFKKSFIPNAVKVLNNTGNRT